MSDRMIELDDDQVLDQLEDLARLDTASLTGRYTPATVARVVRWMSLEMKLRSLPRQDALPHDFAFKVAARVGIVEADSGHERTWAAAALAVVTGSGVGALAWMSRLIDLADFAGASLVTDLASRPSLGAAALTMPILIGVVALGFYAAIDRWLPGLIAKRRT
jgi:hypothetical protein